MNTVLVLENYHHHIGGVEVVFKQLCEGLVRKGHIVEVVTHQLKGSKPFEKLNGVRIHRINCFHNRYWFSFLAIPLVVRLARQADIVHTTTYNGALPAKIASRICRKPSVITIHEILGSKWISMGGMKFFSAKLHQILEWLIIHMGFSAVIAVSKSTQRELIERHIKSKIIYNGIDYQLFNPRNANRRKIRSKLGLSESFVYIFYGRPGISKGLECLLRAVPHISKIVKNSRLVAIVSKDEAYKRRYNLMVKLIHNLGIKDQVMLLDPVKHAELPDYIAASDCVVVPSLSEGFGFSAAEACAMGKPVVASNTTSLPEVVSGRYILARPGDPSSIAEGVISVAKGKVASHGKKVFRWEKTIDSYENRYMQLT